MAFFLSAIPFFLANLYLISNLPGSRDDACVIGANINPVNIIFVVITGMAFGLLVAGMVEIYLQRRTAQSLKKKQNQARAGKGIFAGLATVLGGVISFFTVFCVACTLPFISIFGAAISLNFFTDFEIEFKLLSLTLMFLALYLLNRQLEGCAVCEK